MQIIYTVDALAGAGKTYGACIWALAEARKDRKILIVQPSQALIQETVKTLKGLGCEDVKVTELTSRTVPWHVKLNIIEHLKSAVDDVGEILLISHSAFIDLGYFHKKHRWTVIIDELPSVIDDLSLTVPEEHTRLTDHIDLAPFNATYSRVVTTGNADVLLGYAKNTRGDQVWAVFGPVAKQLLNPHWSVYAHTANYHRILGSGGDGDGDSHRMTIFAKLDPSVVQGFDTVILMAAMLKESLLYALWSADRVIFKAHPIQELLRYQKHTNGNLITVEYLWDGAWSKTFRDKTVPGTNQTVWEQVVEKTTAAMGSEPFIYIANKDVETELGGKFKTGMAVSSLCHGLNRYDGIDRAVFLSALNPTPACFAFVDALGINSDEMRRAMYLQGLYQAIMRISTRNPESRSKKHIVVMDKDAADYLQLHFPGCTVRRSVNAPAINARKNGRPKLYRDDAARFRAAAIKQRVIDEAVKLGLCTTRKCISIVGSIHRGEVLSHDISSNQALMTDLRSALQLETSKYENILISPADFDPRKAPETKRGLANITSVNGIWLDNDGGDLTPEGLRKLFPDLWFAAYSSHSNAGRYRVFIPTKSPMTVEGDGLIKQMILKVITDAGFKDKGDKIHGFDKSKLVASSLFFIPCRAPGDNAAFFTEYSGLELDPITWIQNSVPVIYSSTPQPMRQVNEIRHHLSQGHGDRTEDKIAEAVATYLEVPKGRGLRNQAFFLLGVTLRKIGCSPEEIRGYLMSVAADKDRRDQVTSVLSSLGKRPLG